MAGLFRVGMHRRSRLPSGRACLRTRSTSCWTRRSISSEPCWSAGPSSSASGWSSPAPFSSRRRTGSRRAISSMCWPALRRRRWRSTSTASSTSCGRASARACASAPRSCPTPISARDRTSGSSISTSAANACPSAATRRSSPPPASASRPGWAGEYQYPLGSIPAGRPRNGVRGKPLAAARRRQHLAQGIPDERVRHDDRLGPCRAALADRPRQRGEPAPERAPSLDRVGARGASHHDIGLRVEGRHRLNRRTTVNGQLSRHERRYDN